jgi:Protein of unknown function (DUF4089)
MSTNKEIEDYLDAASALLGLPIRPEHRNEVLAAFHVLVEHGKLVTEFTLPEAIEAAPRFTP